jgi:hypothetical protein
LVPFCPPRRGSQFSATLFVRFVAGRCGKRLETVAAAWIAGDKRASRFVPFCPPRRTSGPPRRDPIHNRAGAQTAMIGRRLTALFQVSKERRGSQLRGHRCHVATDHGQVFVCKCTGVYTRCGAVAQGPTFGHRRSESRARDGDRSMSLVSWSPEKDSRPLFRSLFRSRCQRTNGIKTRRSPRFLSPCPPRTLGFYCSTGLSTNDQRPMTND